MSWVVVGFEMQTFSGKAISWKVKDGVIEVALHREPCNEIGAQSLQDLEQLASALPVLEETAHALIIYSQMSPEIGRAHV